MLYCGRPCQPEWITSLAYDHLFLTAVVMGLKSAHVGFIFSGVTSLNSHLHGRLQDVQFSHHRTWSDTASAIEWDVVSTRL